jgi:HEAT repeat protein
VYKGLILVVTMLACAAPRTEAGEGEEKAVAAIQALGGEIRRGPAQANAPVIGVVFRQKNLAGDDLRHLASLPDLEYVIFFTVTLKGEGLKHLKGLKKLHTLGLGFTTLPSEKTWDDLKELTQLKQIGLGYTTIAGQREPDQNVREALPRVKIIGPLVNGPPAQDAPKRELSYQGVALSQLVGKLKSPDVKVRLETLGRLRNVGPPAGPLVPAFAAFLKDPEPDARRSAAEILGLVGPVATEAVSALTAALKDANKGVRVAAAIALTGIDPKNRAPLKVLADALKADHADLRTSAAAALLRVDPGNKEALAAFADLLADRDESVRAGAAVALRKIGPPARAAVPTLVRALEHPNPSTRANAAAALGEIGPVTEAVVPALVAALKPPVPKAVLLDDSAVRERAAEALGKFGVRAKSAVAGLTAALKSPVVPVRLKAAGALLAIDPENREAVAVVLDVLGKNENASGLADVVAKVGPAAKSAVPRLLRLLGAGTYDERLTAARLLGAIGPAAKEAVPRLTQSLTVPQAPRFEFAVALARIDPGNKDAVALLVRELGGNKNWSQRRWAARYLRSLGPSARAAVPALTAALADPDLEVRWEAAQALNAIGPGAVNKGG